MAISELHSYVAFWTIDCALFRSVEWFLREFPHDSSLRIVADAVENRGIQLPEEPLLCHSVDQKNWTDESDLTFFGREIDRIVIRQSQRRVDFRWVTLSEKRRWRRFPKNSFKLHSHFVDEILRAHIHRAPFALTNLFVGMETVEIDAEQEVGAVLRNNGDVLLLPSCGQATTFIANIFEEAEVNNKPENLVKSLFVARLVITLLDKPERANITREELNENLHENKMLGEMIGERVTRIDQLFNVDELYDIFHQSNWSSFDSSVWERRNN